MQSHSFFVENLKCNGCANSIRKEISKYPEISSVRIEADQSLIIIEFSENFEQLDALKHKLARIGYPEMGQNSFASAAVSYISCAVGRIGGKAI